METIARICSERTATVFGLDDRKGFVRIGADADLAIVDLNRSRKVGEDLFPETYSVFEGRELRGWPTTVLLRGDVILDDDQYVERPGRGIYLPRQVRRSQASAEPPRVGMGA